tara:strand:- start:1029 stop:1517 length:489 start_codon:yes stop_codon:yes gene_type:complete
MARGKRGQGARKKNNLKIEPVKTIKNLFKKGQKVVENVNPNSEINKKINKKKEEVASGNVKAKSQLSVLQRKKKDIKLSDVRAAQKKRMTDSAKARTKQFKEDRAAKKAGKKTSYEGYDSAYDKRQAERKQAMRDRAKAKHKAWKEERKNKKSAKINKRSRR